MPRCSPLLRLVKPQLFVALLVALLGLFPARGAVIYSGLVDLAIPTSFEGIYLDIQSGVASGSEFGGWDFNPFFGGVGVANSPDFQPARVGTSEGDAIVRFDAGASISSGLLFASDYGGSDSHLGPGPGQFGIGQEGYLGFRLITNGGLSHRYGWVRVVFTANTGGAMIRDWAYEDSGSSVVAGRVHQSPAVAGVQVTTFSPGAGESFTYGSLLGSSPGNVGALSKVGAGTTIITADQSFTGATTVSGGILEIGGSGKLSGTTSVTINAGGTLLFSGAGGTNARLNPAAPIALGGGTLSAGGLSLPLDQSFGALTLSQSSTIDFSLLASGHSLRFGASAGATWAAGQVLQVFNYTPGSDRLFFGSNDSSLTTSQLAAVRFYSDNGITLLNPGPALFAGSTGEIVPIPEPTGTVIALGLAWLAVVREGRRDRRRMRMSR